MKRICVWWLCCLGILGWARAQSVEGQYVHVYNLMQEAEALRTSGDESSALTRYLEAQTALNQIQKVYPSWNPKVVNFRLQFLENRIAAVSKSTPAPAASGAQEATQSQVVKGTEPTVADNADLKREIASLQESVRRLQSEKTILEAKLKEAFSTQPAAIDPGELAKAQARIQTLLKENELLQARLEQEQKRTAPSETEALAAVRAENELLKKQLAQAQAAATSAPDSSSTELAQQLAAAQARIAALNSDAEVMRLEKVALENRLVAARAAQTTPTAKSEIVSRGGADEQIKELERQRDELYRALERRNAGSVDNARTQQLMTQVNQLTREVESLKARLEVFEAKAIPYSAEELALMAAPKPTPELTALPSSASSPSVNGAVAGQGTPGSVMALAARAQQLFASRQYDKAEEDYLAILRQDENDPKTLANLAAIQIELGHLSDAETHLNQALALAPDHPHANQLMGYLKFREGKYDEAIAALNRAAKLNPQNADIQNYLGVTLSQKGLRGPAEQAFRKAITLNPAHGGAQNNLAVFYASEEPPNIPLARFHYEKAIKAGQPRNPDLEQLFETKAAATKSGVAR